jgi:hypothetical protein
MTVSLSAKLDIALDITLTDVGLLNTIKETLKTGSGSLDPMSRTLTTGTGVNQGNKIWYDKRTLANGANDDFDLTALTARGGAALSFSKVRWVIIFIDAPATSVKLIFKGSTATNPVALWKGSAAADEDIHDLLVRGNGVDGWSVTNGASDVLRLTASGADVTYRIFIIGN